jgi:hypothetical protein
MAVGNWNLLPERMSFATFGGECLFANELDSGCLLDCPQVGFGFVVFANNFGLPQKGQLEGWGEREWTWTHLLPPPFNSFIHSSPLFNSFLFLSCFFHSFIFVFGHWHTVQCPIRPKKGGDMLGRAQQSPQKFLQ